MISYGVQTEIGARYFTALKGQLPGNLINVVQIGFVPDSDGANDASAEILRRGGVATTLISSEAADACGKTGMIIVVESEFVQARV